MDADVAGKISEGIDADVAGGTSFVVGADDFLLNNLSSNADLSDVNVADDSGRTKRPRVSSSNLPSEGMDADVAGGTSEGIDADVAGSSRISRNRSGNSVSSGSINSLTMDTVNLKIASNKLTILSRRNPLSLEVFFRYGVEQKTSCISNESSTGIFVCLPEWLPFSYRKLKDGDMYVIKRTRFKNLKNLYYIVGKHHRTKKEVDIWPMAIAVMKSLVNTPANQLADTTPQRSVITKAWNKFINRNSDLFENNHVYPPIAKSLWEGAYSELKADVS